MDARTSEQWSWTVLPLFSLEVLSDFSPLLFAGILLPFLLNRNAPFPWLFF